MSERRILIVDDEATIRTLLRHTVSGPGIGLFEADSAERALECAAEHAPFDLVIADVMMPGMDGVELAFRLREQGSARRFLFISGFCDRQSLESRIAGLEAQFLAKPFSIPELIRVVRATLEESRAGRLNGARPRRRTSR